MSNLGKKHTGVSAMPWSSKGNAFFEEWHGDLITLATTTGAKGQPDQIIDGNDAWELGFLMIPTGGSATVAIERSLDHGETWLAVAALALGASATAVEKIDTAPLGLYRCNVGAVADKVTVRFLKKVALVR